MSDDMLRLDKMSRGNGHSRLKETALTKAVPSLVF